MGNVQQQCIEAYNDQEAAERKASIEAVTHLLAKIGLPAGECQSLPEGNVLVDDLTFGVSVDDKRLFMLVPPTTRRPAAGQWIGVDSAADIGRFLIAEKRAQENE